MSDIPVVYVSPYENLDPDLLSFLETKLKVEVRELSDSDLESAIILENLEMLGKEVPPPKLRKPRKTKRDWDKNVPYFNRN